MHKPLKTIVSVAVLSVIAAGAVQAGGFSLYTESSPAAIGNYAAGVAAEAADASIGWYNPAGLVLIQEQQLTVGGVGVFPTSKLNGTSTFSFPALPSYEQEFTGISGGESALVPAFHYALPLGENATFGLSIVSPFGLSTDWGVNSPVRYQATFSELITSNVSPELGARVSDNFSVGAGLDLQYAQVKFNQIIGMPFYYNLAGDPTLVDSLSYNKGHSFGVGFHAGIMGVFNDKHTRVGLNYQSKMRHVFNGYSQLTGRLANDGMPWLDPLVVAGFSADAVYRMNNLSSGPIELPDVVTLSGFHDVNDTWSVLGSVVYTGWSSFKEIRLNNVAIGSPTSLGTIQSVPISIHSPQNYSDAWRVALGVNYHVCDKWMIRVGGGYDQSPTNDVDRDVRLPDVDRWALSVGTHYQARPNLGIDVGYTHLFAANDLSINRTDDLGHVPPIPQYNVNVTSGSVSADLVGAQVVWAIDKV
jgi:long-chain fatty acid transport protein